MDGPDGAGPAAIRLTAVTTARLPLFPLNAVLFPGLVLPLNVFEERYRAMMRELLTIDDSEPRRFAVVAIRDGREVAPTAPGMPDQTALPERGPAAGFGSDPIQSFHRVGCIADAATIRERADGSFEVMATGTTRVKLLSVDATGPFLVAEIEEIPEEQGEEAWHALRGGSTGLPQLSEAAGRGAGAFTDDERAAGRPLRGVVPGRGGGGARHAVEAAAAPGPGHGDPAA